MTNEPDQLTFKRGQVDQALWSALSARAPGAPKQPVPAFLTRVKRVLEIDRRAEPIAGAPDTAAPFAFASVATGGQGADAAFSSFDAFCLALALDLVDAGYKPSEVIILIRLIRAELKHRFGAILAAPPPGGRQRQLARHRVELPSYKDEKVTWADPRVFMVIRKVELKEIYAPGSEDTDIPLILQPTFCRGIEVLKSELHKMGLQFRQAHVLELAYLAFNLNAFLASAHPTRRGRP